MTRISISMLAIITLSLNCFGQIDSVSQVPFVISQSFVQFTGQIQLKDSQYLLITRLNLIENEKIQVKKNRIYDQENYHTDGRLYLQKIVRNHFVNISVNAFKHFKYEYETESPWLILGQNQPLLDTIPLGELFPFELGEYRLLVELDYLYKNRRFIATIEPIYFDAPIIPKSHIYY